MAFLIAAVVLVGVLCLLNLLLMMGVLRRLREHTAELQRLAGGTMTPLAYDPTVLVGRALPEGAAGARLVGFFDVGCDTCHERAPEFAETARGENGGALAVVTGDPAEAGDLLHLMSGVAGVVTGDDALRIAESVGVKAFPTFLRTGSDGTVVAADTELTGLAPLAHRG
ncbi:hypothetical protein MTP10_23095 [Nonomuraea sp. 3-1Str]|uniref:hypothetical protein n=1 Tax=Nonomuraea sp. 3-1Str TaxID=2929801 RepID=UPI0028611FB4|nr:hypothetical protein [Nonomuraea sp. 3-1Str]MDR8411611.1 hypothetical protein [Nonomuraea sp. 3-1Str]